MNSDSPSLHKDFFQNAFTKLEQQGGIGLAILDPKLCFVHANRHLAALLEGSVDDITGLTLQDVDAAASSVLEPLLNLVVMGERAVIRQAVRLPPNGTQPSRDLWVRCSALHSDDGELLGVSFTALDLTTHKPDDSTIEDRLRFEALLSEFSAAFINVPTRDIDGKIEQGLQKIVDFLDFDRSTIWHVSKEDGRLHLTHSHAREGISHPPTVIQEDVPVWNKMWQLGQIFHISDVDDLPEDQWKEKAYCEKLGGIKSVLFIPLQVGGTNCGIISFVSYRVKRTWPEPLIQRLRLLSDIIENALERKRADEKIQLALTEINDLKDRLEAENVYLRDQIEIEQKHGEIVGRSAAIQNVLRQVQTVAGTDSTVLVLGETGTGKELVARAIHNLSPRQARTMVKVNCAALPPSLIEMELFGREKGAYTGAVASQVGRFEAANGSTLFLDEIGELPLDLQAKLLRVLQEGQFERLGSSKPTHVDVRVIAATNRNLKQAIQDGTFREDLYYRLNVFPISVPPLRERQGDIPSLVWAIVREFAALFGKTIDRIPKKCMDNLQRYAWPGNVRELRNMIERAMILSNSPTLTIDLPENSPATPSPAQSLEEVERTHILSVMESTGWRVRGQNGAAEILKIKPTTLDAKMKRLGIRRKYLPARTP